MSFKGRSFKIKFQGMGFNANPNFDGTPAGSIVTPSSNISLVGGLRKRGGTSHVNSAALDSTPSIYGLFNYYDSTNTSRVMAGCQNGKYYADANATEIDLYTATAASFFDSAQFNDKVYTTIWRSTECDKPIKWDGVNSTAIPIHYPKAPIADLGTGVGSCENGTHLVRITFVTGTGETGGGFISSSVNVVDNAVNGKIELTSIPIGPSSVTSRKVYMTAANTSTPFKLVATIADNTTQTYTINIADGGLGADEPEDSTTDLLPGEWQGTHYPKQFIKHGFGNSERLWACATPGFEKYVYASANNDGSSDANFSTSDVFFLYIETGDRDGIVALAEFQDRLIAFGKKQAYMIEDSNVDTDLWGYVGTPWLGGAASHRLIAVTPQDMFAMQDDGEIYSISAAQQYGDFKLASISRPDYIHEWIKDNIDLTQILKFHCIYDPKIRAVRFFMVKTGSTNPDVCMTYYLDYGKWGAPESNISFDSGFNNNCSAVFKGSDGTQNIWTGGTTGFIWKLNQTDKNDNGESFDVTFRTPYISVESNEDDTGFSDYLKMYHYGRLIGVPYNDYSVGIVVYSDGVDSSYSDASLDGLGGSGQNILDVQFNIGLVAKRISIEISNNTVNEDFMLSGMELFYNINGAIDNIVSGPSGSSFMQADTGISTTLRDVYFDGDIVIACGDGGVILVSNNYGVHFDTAISGTTKNLYAVTSDGNGIYVVVGNGIILKSSNGGTSWSSVKTFSDNRTMYDVEHGLNKFVAVGIDTTAGTNFISYYSSNGTTWTEVIPGMALNIRSMAFGNSVFVGLEVDGTKAVYSSNGTTWTDVLVGINYLKYVMFGNGKFIIRSDTSSYLNTTPPFGQNDYYSTDGSSWYDLNSIKNGTTNNIRSIVSGAYTDNGFFDIRGSYNINSTTGLYRMFYYNSNESGDLTGLFYPLITNARISNMIGSTSSILNKIYYYGKRIFITGSNGVLLVSK